MRLRGEGEMFIFRNRMEWSVPARVAMSVLVICACLLLSNVRSTGAADTPAVEFKWAFGALTEEDGQSRIVPVGRDATLKTGDRLKLMVEMKRKTFIYVFHHTERDGLTLLFPYSFEQFTADYRPAVKYYIPRGEAWFELDKQPGAEKFYLLASAERLLGLEALYTSYRAGDAQTKHQLSNKILEKIRTLKRQGRDLAAPAERPVAIGGAVRGVPKQTGPALPDVATLAEEIASSGVVARTYNVEHK